MVLTSITALVLLIATTCFFGVIMGNVDLNVYIIARENVLHPCKIGELQIAQIVRRQSDL